jgi:hypothetical protein
MPRNRPCHQSAQSQLYQLVGTLERMGGQGETRGALARILRTAPIGLGNCMPEVDRRGLFGTALIHSLDWSPALVERWRRICALTPKAFLWARPYSCGGRSWFHPTCVCAHWRSAARHLLWVGGGLTLETFAEPELDPRRLMFDLYPSAIAESVTAAFTRTTSGPWTSEALALWALGPWKEGAIARRRLSRLPQAHLSPLVEAILFSASWHLPGPDAIGPLLRRLPLHQQLRLVARTLVLQGWTAFNSRVLRAIARRDPDVWRLDEFVEILPTVLKIASTMDGAAAGAGQRVIDAARLLIPRFGERGVQLVLEFIRTGRNTSLPPGVVACLLQYPDARIREAALEELANR